MHTMNKITEDGPLAIVLYWHKKEKFGWDALPATIGNLDYYYYYHQ